MKHSTYNNIMLLLVFLLFICKFEYCYSNNGSCIEVERVALLRFKESLIDKSNRLSSWTGLDCCAWEGVSCGSVTGHVWKLDLHNQVTLTYQDERFYYSLSSGDMSNYSNNCLRGKISHSLINLTYLNYLDLSLNNFSEIQIPEFLGSLKNMRYLNLSNSGFVGNIPPHLGNLSRLEYLHLGMAPDLIYASVVTNDLVTNNLDWLANLSSLKSLDMSKVLIQGSENLFGTINKLVSLSSLNLYECNLNFTNPPSLVNSTSLISLNLQRNKLDTMTLLWLSNLTRLENLDLAYSFNSSLLIPFCKLLNLVSMDLSLNDIPGLIPHCFGNLTCLTSLNLASNRFEGSIPNSISLGLCRLQSLDLSDNELSGSLTDSLGAPSECLSYSLQMLFLDDNHFTGQLPNQLYMYKNLNSLSLTSNSLSGPIADSLGNLSMLSLLDIFDNKFSGSIPTSLRELSNLHTFVISYNSFQGILSESHFAKVTNLRELKISGNSLFLDVSSNWIPPFQLEYIEMDSMKVGPHFPQWLRTQIKVQFIKMANASISDAVPDWFGNLFWMCSEIDLSNNNIRGELPMNSAEGYMNEFKDGLRIDLSGNHLTGEIPKWLCNLKNLEYLDISSNKLSGEIPSCFGKLQELERLDLGNNHLFGLIPDSLGNLSMLSWLDISNNKFSGSIPTSLGQLSNLQELYISNNSFQGILSESHFSKLTNLYSLAISGNSVFLDVSSKWIPPFQLGDIEMDSIKVGPRFPQWLHTQINVQSISMSNASISDALPDWFGNLISTCWRIDLSKNNIRGELLMMSVEVGSMRQFRLSSNLLTGEIPKELCNSKDIWILDISSNKLSGEIPSCFGKLQELQYLYLGNNQLFGHIPNSLGSLSNLISLHLQNNKFEGGLPSSLHNLGRLITLDLSENGLMDVIPPWIGENLASLRFLNFQKNKFFGDIPFQLCYLKALQLLNLANNNISGPIPSCFNNFTAMDNDSILSIDATYADILSSFEEKIYEDIKGLKLEYTRNLIFLKSIDLSGNHITGEIPLEVMSLQALSNLNLSRNNLSGTIPQTIGDLSKIESLDLSMNALSGPIPQSLSSLNFLSYLNLSFNKLYGRIPTGHQLQTLDNPSIYIGNDGLCGVPLLKSCPGDDKPSFVKQPTETKLTNDDREFLMWFYAGLGPGFFVGFIGVLCTLLFKTSWRYAYFKCLEITFNKVFCCISIKRNRR